MSLEPQTAGTGWIGWKRGMVQAVARPLEEAVQTSLTGVGLRKPGTSPPFATGPEREAALKDWGPDMALCESIVHGHGGVLYAVQQQFGESFIVEFPADSAGAGAGGREVADAAN